MIIQMYRRIFRVSFIFLIFTSCGQMDTVFSSDGVYKISAKVGQYTLDECAVIRSDAPIHPYFIKSVDEDPDIWKLTVFLQNLHGELLSKKVTYIIDPDKETSTFQSDSQDSSGETDKTDSAFPAGSGFGYDPGIGTDSGITAGSASEADPGSGTDPAFTADSPPDADPGDPAPQDTNSGDQAPGDIYPLDGTAEEPGENDGAYRFLKRETASNNPSLPYNEDVIYVKKLGGDLPPLFLPKNMEPGQYILVFQIIGKQGILRQIDTPFYYIGTSEFVLDDIHVYLPGIFDKSHLVPPEMPIMLETKLAAGANLNPYVVWYNGKKRIHEGYVADGVARFIWRAPAQTGFHTLKVEAFPFRPLNTGMRTPIGRIKELSLPVSAKNENLSFSSIPAGSETGSPGNDLIPVRRYQLFANLEDSQDSQGSRITGKALAAMNHTPKWLPQGNIFGLAVGPDHGFSIPGPLFTLTSQAEGCLLFRFVPLTDGTIFSGSFNLKPGLELKNGLEPKEWFETLNMDLSYAGGTVRLNYSAGSVSGEKNIFLFPGQIEGVITVLVSFQVQKDTLRLSLGLNTSGEFLADEGIPLPGPLTGDGTFYLGAVPGKAGTEAGNTTQAPPAQPFTEEAADQIFTTDTDDPASTAETAGLDARVRLPAVTESKPVSPVIILDEFVFFIAPDIPADNGTQTITANPVPPAGIQEDAPVKTGLGDEHTQSDSGETAGEPEITVLSPSPPPKTVDETGGSFVLAE
jgi:hypothetical protein